MGRAKKSEKSARSEDLEEKEPEPYQPTGQFHTDFSELCKELEISRPPVVCQRTKRPSSPTHHDQSQAPAGKKGGKEDKKQQQQQVQEPEEETPEEKAVMELLGFKPKTFVVKSHLEMMKPAVQVEMEHPDKQDTVAEVFIRDWRLQPQMLQTLCRCFEKLHKLHTINLWRVAPDASLIRVLAEQLQQLPSVKSLALECSGCVPEENFAELLRPDTHLTKVQLRFNGITDKGAALIAQQLYGLQEPSSKIVSLDLSSNKIGDEGALALAQNLRTNRTLIHLSLSNNVIGDAGATALAEVCSRFFLTHEEIVERRKLMSVDSGSSPDSRQSRPTSSVITPPPSRKGADRPGSVRSQEKGDKKTAGKAAKGKKEEKGRADDKGKGKGQKDDAKGKGKGAAAQDKDSKGGVRSGKGRGSRVKVSTPQQEPEQQQEIHFDSDHPLLEKADSAFAHGYLLIPGNYVLALLNLSRNQIGDSGIAAWKTAVRYQAAYMGKNKVKGTGLLKLLLQGNPYSAETENFKALEEALSSRDPLRSSTSD